MKRLIIFILGSFLFLAGCETQDSISQSPQPSSSPVDEVSIGLADDQILINGSAAEGQEQVTVSKDIVYYPEGQDETFGEGTAADAHSEAEAQGHTVITIRKPGTYRISGKLSAGQIAVDLGEEAESDPTQKVTLILDNADITCTVAPAIIVYHAYESNPEDTVDPETIDTKTAGVTLVLADGSGNIVRGSYVARIYKENTTQKQHKYDAAIESKVSMIIQGESDGTGKLTVNAENEGIETARHLTINSGQLIIHSADDALNANEDGVSVITVNGGTVQCDTGLGTEGDGIDSNGWIVINGGTVIASANSVSMDSGLDSDSGILIHGGTVLATGNMLDEISEESRQAVMILGFQETQTAASMILLTDSGGQLKAAMNAVNDYTILVYSGAELSGQTYTLEQADMPETLSDTGLIETSAVAGIQGSVLGWTSTSQGMPGRGQGPDPKQQADGIPQQKPDSMPEGGSGPGNASGEQPNGQPPLKDSAETPMAKDDKLPGRPDFEDGSAAQGTLSTAFEITSQLNSFYGIRPADLE